MNPSFSSRPSVLVLGANGRLGSAAAQAFDAAGWQVLVQVRRDPVPGLPGGATVLRGALADTAALARAAAGVRVVVHAVNPVYTRWDAEAMPALEAGLALAGSLGAHFMLPGNVYAYGRSMPQCVGEDTPAHPDTRKGEIRAAMEALIARRASAGGFSASVVRAGDFFGGGTGSWLDQVIVKSLGAGKLVYPGPLDVPHAWAYLPDLARAFVRVASLPQPRPFDTWHFEGHTVTGREFLAAVETAAAALGLSPAKGWRHGSLPWPLIATVGLVYPTWRELARMSWLWRVPHGLDGRKLAALSGGVTPATPLVAALRESLLALGFAARPVGPRLA